MPKNIYDRCPTMVVKDLVYTHPHFMLVDAFRIYTDIIIFNWRLSKTFNRFTKLQSYYQFDENFKFEKINYESKIKDLDKNFEIPELFIAKYNLFKKLETKDKLSWENFILEYVTPKVKTSYERLF